jgi:RNA polymerase-binding transcription factor DksA
MASETDQILRAHNPDAKPQDIEEKWRGIYDRLVALRDELIDSHHDLQAKAREIQPDAIKSEPSELGTDTFQRDYALGMASTEQEQLAEVIAAIERIKNGTYGICEITREPIPIERLEAVPWTRCTVEGQRILEQRGGTSKASIGHLGPR